MKSLKKGAGSVIERYGSADPDPHQNVTDPHHWFALSKFRHYHYANTNLRLLALKP
jgi:hypothetical protein